MEIKRKTLDELRGEDARRERFKWQQALEIWNKERPFIEYAMLTGHKYEPPKSWLERAATRLTKLWRCIYGGGAR